LLLLRYFLCIVYEEVIDFYRESLSARGLLFAHICSSAWCSYQVEWKSVSWFASYELGDRLLDIRFLI